MANDVHLLQVVGAVAGEPVEIVLAFEASIANANSPLTNSGALVTLVETWFETELMACEPDDYVLIGYKAKRVNNGGGPSAALPRNGVNGTRGENSISSGQGPVVIWNYNDVVSVPPRWRTGRTFIPGIAKDDLTENDLNPLLRAAVDAFVAVLQTPTADGGGTTWTFKLWSRKNSAAITVDSGSTSGVVGTQRRRLHPAL